MKGSLSTIAAAVLVLAAGAGSARAGVPAQLLPLTVTAQPGTTTCSAEIFPLSPEANEQRSVDGSPVGCGTSAADAFASIAALQVWPATGPLTSQVSAGGSATVTDFAASGQASSLQASWASAAVGSENEEIVVSNPNDVAVPIVVAREEWGAVFSDAQFYGVDAHGSVLNEGIAERDTGLAIHRLHYDTPTGCRLVDDTQASWIVGGGPTPAFIATATDPQYTEHTDVTSDSGLPCPSYTTVPAHGSVSLFVAQDEDAYAETAPQSFGTAVGTFSEVERTTISLADAQGPTQVDALRITAHSPVNLLVTAPDGKRVGFDGVLRRIVDEVPGGQYSGQGSEPQTVTIPAPDAGRYAIDAVGTGSGPYTIDVQSLDVLGNVLATTETTGTASLGSSDTILVALATTGALDAGADTTPPTVSCASADGSWHADNATIACTASDGGSGLADPLDAAFSLATHVDPGTETASAQTDSEQVCDKVGNCTTAGPVGGNMIDRKAPTVAIATPASSAAYTLGQAITPSYRCVDGGSGVAVCAGGAIDTGSVGSKTFAVHSVDAVGNAADASVGYAVAFGVCPLYDPAQAKRAGSAYPIKLQLCDAAGRDVSAAVIRVHAVAVDGAPVVGAGNADPGGDFRYDSSLPGYVFNLKTDGLAAGAHLLTFTAAGDPTVHQARFTIR